MVVQTEFESKGIAVCENRKVIYKLILMRYANMFTIIVRGDNNSEHYGRGIC